MSGIAPLDQGCENRSRPIRPRKRQSHRLSGFIAGRLEACAAGEPCYNVGLPEYTILLFSKFPIYVFTNYLMKVQRFLLKQSYFQVTPGFANFNTYRSGQDMLSGLTNHATLTSCCGSI